MKKLSKCISLLLVLFLLASCSNSKIEQTNKTNEGQDNIVVVYSPHGGDERGQYIVKRAKEETGLDVQFLSGGGGTLVDRLLAEKNNPQADVGMALNPLLLYKLKDNDVLMSYEPKWLEGLPEKYKDKDNYFYGFGRTPIVIAYNNQYISEEDSPKGWLDLIKPEYKNKYSVGSLENQTVRVYLSAMLWRFYDKEKKDLKQEGWEFLNVLYENAATDDKSNIEYSLVANGQTPIVLDWLGGVKKQAQNSNIDMKYVDSEEGTPIVAESLTLIKGSKNTENGKKFIEWFGSPEFQAEYANEFFYFGQVPLHPKAVELCNDEIKQESKLFVEQEIDLSIVSRELDKWLAKIEVEIK